MHYKQALLITGILVLWIGPLGAQTPARKSGDTFVYEIVAHIQISGGHLPSQAYAQQPLQTSSIKIAVTGLEPDGTAQVHVAIDRPFPEKEIASKMTGGLLAGPRNAAIMSGARKEWEEQNRYKQFEAKFTRDGALLVAVDNSPQSNDVPTPKAMTQAELAHFRDAVVADVHSPDYQARQAENEVAGTFTVPNVIALSCAKHQSLATGDTWHVVSKSDGSAYDVTVTGKEIYHGHDSVLLRANSHFDNPSTSNTTEANVYYDPQAHLVLGMHSVVTSNVQVTGVTSTSTTDLELK